MVDRLSRFAPLTGVVYALLTLVAFASASGAPSNSASGAKVISFYESHRTSARASDTLWMVAFAFFVLFAGTLRSHLARQPSADALSAVALAGAAVFAAGAIVYFNFDFALAAVPQHLAPAAAQALNVLALNMAACGFRRRLRLRHRSRPRDPPSRCAPEMARRGLQS